MRRFLGCFWALWLGMGFSAFSGPLLSVGLELKSQELEVTSELGFQILDPQTGAELAKVWGGESAAFSWERFQDQVLSPQVPSGGHPNLLLRPLLEGRLSFHNRPYRGQFLVRPDPTGGINLINLVDLEEYLRGVLPKEISPSAHGQALRVQAVASRTYALKHAEDFSHRGFGLKATEGSQVYRGVSAEDPRTDEAILDTQGQVLRSGKELIHAWFSAACGGRTASNESVWKGTPKPYARSVACGFCTIYPGYFWSAKVHPSTLETRLIELGRSAGKVQGLTFFKGKDGRIARVLLRGSHKKLELTGNEFRILAGHREVRSLRFTDSQDPLRALLPEGGQPRARWIPPSEANSLAPSSILREPSLELMGTGFGHGVGLCQWGARGMAQEGYSYREILEHYYRGTRLSDPQVAKQAPGPGRILPRNPEGAS